MTVNRPMNIGDFNVGHLKPHGQSLQICATVDSFILTSGWRIRDNLTCTDAHRRTHTAWIDVFSVRYLTETESHNITQAGPTFSTNTNGTRALLNFYIKPRLNSEQIECLYVSILGSKGTNKLPHVTVMPIKCSTTHAERETALHKSY